jgi:hypothetical protein
MEFEDIEGRIYVKFVDEFRDFKGRWPEFLVYKNLGISFLLKEYSHYYTIVDHKKWLLAKLKYGI